VPIGNRSRRAFGTVVLVALAMAGCSSDDTRVVDGVRQVPNFANAAEVKEASDVVAVVQVEKEAFRGDIREMPSTIFEVRVVDAVKNAANGDKLRVRQFTENGNVRFEDGVQDELQPGRRYLLFLAEEFPGHEAGGDKQLIGLYGILRTTAAYEETGEGRFRMVPGLQPAGPIPTDIARPELTS